ncbi:hypothetical protein WA158_007962 [Blastocystis sp. Blastoise]
MSDSTEKSVNTNTSSSYEQLRSQFRDQFLERMKNGTSKEQLIAESWIALEDCFMNDIKKESDKYKSAESQISELESKLEENTQSLNVMKDTCEQKENENKELSNQIQTLKTELSEKESSIKASMDSISEYKKQIENSNLKLEENENLIKEKDSLLKEKDSLLKEKESIIMEKDSLLKEKESIIMEKDSLLREKEDALLLLKKSKEELEKIYEECKLSIMAKENEISTIQTNLKMKDDQLKENHDTLQHQSSLLSECQSSITELENKNKENENSIQTLQEKNQQIYDEKNHLNTILRESYSLLYPANTDKDTIDIKEIQEKIQTFSSSFKEMETSLINTREEVTTLQETVSTLEATKQHLLEEQHKCFPIPSKYDIDNGIRVVRWVPDDMTDTCEDCNANFSTFNRKHHCRACGRLVCSKCCRQVTKNDKSVWMCTKCQSTSSTSLPSQ